MTAEIGLLNKHGIALAADSAVTIGGGIGYYNTANKLFALSKYAPVSIMVYSNASIMGYPVEIIVKEYRKKLGTKKFNTLREYYKDFLKYLKEFFNTMENINYIEYYSNEVYEFLNYINNLIIQEMSTMKFKNTDEVEQTLTCLLNNHADRYFYDMNKLPNDEIFINKRQHILDDLDLVLENVNEIFGINLDSALIYKIKEICSMLLTKKHQMGNTTGVVITGFGENEMYPKLISCEFMGAFYGELKYGELESIEISDQNPAAIKPFAQSDVVNTFINGFDYNIMDEVIDIINNNKDLDEPKRKDIIDSIISKIQDKSHTLHWGPILHTVSVAPKEELAHMAETLVNITSFRRKLSLDTSSQTVGGPIDVALITKGDGLVWIKRKLYFDKELNYSFFNNNYNKEVFDNGYVESRT